MIIKKKRKRKKEVTWEKREMSWLAVSIIPKRTVIVHREKEEREREESREEMMGPMRGQGLLPNPPTGIVD